MIGLEAVCGGIATAVGTDHKHPSTIHRAAVIYCFHKMCLSKFTFFHHIFHTAHTSDMMGTDHMHHSTIHCATPGSSIVYVGIYPPSPSRTSKVYKGSEGLEAYIYIWYIPWSKDVNYDILMCLIHKHSNTNTQI